MIFSIILGLVFLLILIDSIGSKQVRSRVIQAAKHAFEGAMSLEDSSLTIKSDQVLPEPIQRYLKASVLKEKAPPTTLRMKWKGASKKVNKRNWVPIEQKLFLSYHPLSIIQYQDTTLGLFLSLKSFLILNNGRIEEKHRLFSLFNQSKLVQDQIFLNGWSHYLALLAWRPEFIFSEALKWEAVDKKKSKVQLNIDQKQVQGTFYFNNDGLIKQFISTNPTHTTSLQFEYSDYREYNDLMIPFHCKISHRRKNTTIRIAEFDVTDLVYDEQFAWW